MVTISYQVPDEATRKDIQSKLKLIRKRNPSFTNNFDAYELLFQLYFEGKEIEEDWKETQTYEVQDLIALINCEFLEWEGDKGFQCYEKFHEKKKPQSLGGIENIQTRCSKCEIGKQAKIQNEIERALRKKNIKGILDLRNVLVQLSQDGGLAQIFICKAELHKGKINISGNGISIPCPQENDNEVSIINHCQYLVNPETLQPPCEYLVNPYVKVKLQSEEAKDIIETLEITDQTKATAKKKIDAEVIDNE